ncbi:hypothetical protein ACTG9Q_28545 [Actinokineospora sp. 24-640]
MKKILGSVSDVALGVNELHNLTGTGTRTRARRVGRRPAMSNSPSMPSSPGANSCSTPLIDPNAPWRSRPPS